MRELTPIYEEHVKMFAPLGFVPGADAGAGRGGRRGAAAGTRPGCRRVEHYMKLGSWFAGTPDDLVAFLKGIEEKYPGMEHINLSTR